MNNKWTIQISMTEPVLATNVKYTMGDIHT